MKKTSAIVLAAGLLICSTASRGEQIVLLTCRSDTYLVAKAAKRLQLPAGVKVAVFSDADIEGPSHLKEAMAGADVIIVDVMNKELTDYLLASVPVQRKHVYAVRTCQDVEALKKKGVLFDEGVRAYFNHLSLKNVQNLIRRVAHQEFDKSIRFDEVVALPDLGVYHPDADAVFADAKTYLTWYQGRKGYRRDAPRVGLMLLSTAIVEGQVESVNYIIRRLEGAGFSVMPGFGRDQQVLIQFMMDEDRRPRVDLIVAFTLKFASALNATTNTALRDLNVPVFNVLNMYYHTIPQWKEDPRGLSPMEVVWAIANPELSGLIEPTVLTGRDEERDPDADQVVFVHKTVKDNLELLIPRFKMWASLRRKENKEKRVAILFYNHSPGKHNVGGGYLNVFASLERIMKRMKNEGFQFTSRGDLNQGMIRDLVLKCGRNIGSWAPGELDEMLSEGKAVRVPIDTYREWFDKLPQDYRDAVIKQWGRIEDSNIMIKDGEFIIPAIILGNIALMPEPSRGWHDDPMKLYHSPTLYPHHQYTAAYLWIKYGFRADAMIHLGTHATHEWLPGKQAGLSPSCPAEVLITDVPNLYPYVVDDVGEGIQAKRRGRGVVIDYLTPPVKEVGLYHEYSRLYDMISDYNQALARNSETAEVKREEIEKLVREIGVDKDLEIKELDEESLGKVEHYLLELRGNFMPYGLHTYGVSPDGEGLADTVKAIVKRNTGADEKEIARNLVASGPREMDHLIKGLNGGYIPAGEGNDPIRNLQAIPTGKNFYGFDPAKVPSPAAYELGRRAAQDIIDRGLREKRAYPNKVAVVLWAVETIRNEGMHEGTILSLMGLKPTWDPSGRVTGAEVIPAAELKRPRIDVLINPSGLYRDLFPNLLEYLDKAVQKAAAQTDIENLIRAHSEGIKGRLLAEGLPEEEADRLSRVRIFTDKPGDYGNRVCELASASGFWESTDEIAKVWEKHTGYAYGLGMYGASAEKALHENLKGVDVAVHSISSNVIGTMDNDDMYQSLGGLSLAIQKASGKAPDTLITMQRVPHTVQVENIAKTIGRELRSRYLNPKWIEGMKKEDYAGAREMSNFVEYMWGWQVTVASAIDQAKWEQTYGVYVEDKYDLGLKQFFNKENPWAYQSITARMLESIRKSYWNADETTRKRLAAEYVISVIEKGIACCDHTCNNPLLNQMVVNIVSLPGVLSPEMVERFRLAVEKATQKNLQKQTKELRKRQEEVRKGVRQEPAAEDDPTGKTLEQIEGYKMEDTDPRDESSELPSSGAQWLASVFVLAIIALFGLGMRAPKRG